MMIWNTCYKVLRTTLIATGGVLFFAAAGSAVPVSGGDTSVALNAGTVDALVGLGFSIAPVSPATLTGLTATFPITGGDTSTMIDHSGGLAVTKGGTTVDIEDFVINLGTDTLTGSLIAGGATTPNFTFFDIGAGDALTLDAALAGALSSTYGVPNLTGAAIGTATVSAVLTPEPATVSLAACGLLAALVGVSRKRRASKVS
jgi:hypothetical protein